MSTQIRDQQAEQVLTQFLRGKSKLQLFIDADEIQLSDFIKIFSRKRPRLIPLVNVSAIGDIEAAVKLELFRLDSGKTFDPLNSAFELFDLSLLQQPKGILFISDLECINAESLVFLTSLVDAVVEADSKWKIIFTGMNKAIPAFCLRRLGLKTAQVHTHNNERPRFTSIKGTELANQLASVLGQKPT